MEESINALITLILIIISAAVSMGIMVLGINIVIKIEEWIMGNEQSNR